ncbi:sugar O-acetyltransferase [Brachybacterium hainanense]|uniref:Sugar O-acetyltransferase n=1 Tax=Brachybacterium hainanense TaxID=1541174 RepID=A0ABV6R9D8_9MICO
MKEFRAPAPDDPRTPIERMRAGDWYIADDPEIQKAFRAALEAMARFAAQYPTDPEGAQEILREVLGTLGDGAHVRAPLHVDYGSQLHIGPGTFVNFGLTALDVVDIRIGAHCQLGPNIQLLTPVHPLEPEPRRAGWEGAEPITIGDNVWIGGGAIICPGVSIGENAVIGAGSVVTRDVPANHLAVGSPARTLREI